LKIGDLGPLFRDENTVTVSNPHWLLLCHAELDPASRIPGFWLSPEWQPKQAHNPRLLSRTAIMTRRFKTTEPRCSLHRWWSIYS